MLQNSQIDAVVSDTFSLQYLAQQQCGLYQSDTFSKFGLVYIYSNAFSTSEINNINNLILQAQNSYADVIQSAVQSYAPSTQNDATCNQRAPQYSVEYTITDFISLWYIMGSAVVFSFLLRLLPFQLVKPQSLLRYKLEKIKEYEIKHQQRTDKLLKITNRLMEKNENLLASSVGDVQKTIQQNDNLGKKIKNYIRIMKEGLQQDLKTK